MQNNIRFCNIQNNSKQSKPCKFINYNIDEIIIMHIQLLLLLLRTFSIAYYHFNSI